MNNRQTIEIIKEAIKILDEKKAENIVTLDLKKLTTITDFFIIATANSVIHLQTLAKELVHSLKKTEKIIPFNPLSETDTKWILIDYGDFIVHLFLEETRQYYNLEELWFEAKRINFSKEKVE